MTTKKQIAATVLAVETAVWEAKNALAKAAKHQDALREIDRQNLTLLRSGIDRLASDLGHFRVLGKWPGEEPAEPPAVKPGTKYTVVVQEWEESERGFGTRPDGASLHLTEADRAAYCKEYWEREKKRQGGQVPDEYTRESGSPKIVEVDAAMYDKVKNSKNGIQLWQHEYAKLQSG
jgi:hypothetical protein